MFLLTEKFGGFVLLEMLPNCNYQSVLSRRFSCGVNLCKGGREVKLTVFTSVLFRYFKGMTDGVSDLPFLERSVLINLLILC